MADYASSLHFAIQMPESAAPSYDEYNPFSVQ